jgi:phosphoglycerate dehydrogenase-like enzyme
MTKKKLLVVNVEPMDKTRKTYRILEEAGYELILGRDGWDRPGDEYTEEDLIELCKDTDAIIGSSRERYTRRLIESIPNLRIISKHGTGTDKIDIQAATENGVLVTHTPVNSAAVAEHTVALMLALMKRLKDADQKIRKGGWRGNGLVSSLVGGKTVGILGFGRIGAEVAQRLQGWNVRILAYDPSAKPDLMAQYNVEKCTTLEEMLDQVDVLSINAVLTKETHYLIGDHALKRLKKSAYIVNTARGAIIDEKALVKALKERRIAGAALDVMEQEPIDPRSDLLEFDNIILTPHMSAVNPEMDWILTYTAMENTLNALRGEIPKYLKNPEVKDSWILRFGKK